MLNQPQPCAARPIPETTRLRRFLNNRLRELGYGAAFSTVLLCSQSPLNALVIEDIRVLSRLGEPLHAEIPVSAAAGEQLARNCFSTTPGDGDLPEIANVRLALSRQLGGGVLTLRTASAVREPITELVLKVRCPGVPTVVRTFMVMVDPPARVDALTATVGVARRVTARTPATNASPGTPTRQAASNPIVPGSRYIVRSGDMLSTIAARVAGRPDWSVWALAQRIFAANPGAFLLGNPNLIAEGATIDIPQLNEIDFGSATALATDASVRAAPAATAGSQPASNAATAAAGRTATTMAARRDNPPVARIVAAPRTAVTVPDRVAVTLPSMQLTASLSGASRMKLQLRRDGSPARAATATGSAPATASTSNPATPAEVPPQPTPQTPEAVAADQRAALPVQPRSAGLVNWMLWLAGGLVAFLLGGLVAAAVLRRRLKEQYNRDLTDALRIREQQPMPAATAAVAAATPVAAPQAPPITEIDLRSFESAPDDNTVETLGISDLDLELQGDESASAERAATTEMPTLDMPTLEESLDLEFPAERHDNTGQQEVDFDLLERAYSEAYETDVPADTVGVDTDAGAEIGAADERYYHLENRDPADEAPLPIELGEDEMDGGDQGDDSKVVHFPKHSSSG